MPVHSTLAPGGVIPASQLGSGSPTGTKFLRDDGTWQVVNAVGGVTVHSLLSGLGLDDHTQYHTDARGDARYSLLSHTHAGVYQPAATVLTNTTAAFTTAQESKLAGVATGATVNAADAALRDRATHTGTQTAATISDFTEAAQDVVGAMVAAAGGSYDDGAGTMALPSGGGSALSTVATVTVPANHMEHVETVTFTGCTALKRLLVSVAPHADTDENDAEMLDIGAVSASPGADAVTLTLSFREPTSGPIKLNLMAV